MARAPDQLERRAGDRLGSFADKIWRGGAVLIAADRQRRYSEARGAFAEVRIADRGAGADITVERRADEHVAPERELARLPFAERLCEPALKDRVLKRGDAARLDRLDAVLPHLGRSDLGRRVAKHHAAHQFRPLGGQTLRNHTADGEADEDRVFDAERVHDGGGVGHMVAHTPCAPRRAVGQPVPTLVIADDPQTGGHQRDDLVPDPEVGAERVGEDDGVGVFRPLIGDVDRTGFGLDELHE